MIFNKNGKKIFYFGALAVSILSLSLYFWLYDSKSIRVFEDVPKSKMIQIAESLSKEGISVKYPDNGEGLLLDSKKYNQATAIVANSNILNDGSVGWSIFSDQQSSMSEFSQKINYQRAVQGELEKTLVMIDGIEAARVHIALPAEKAFSITKKQVKAVATLTFTKLSDVNRGVVAETAKTLLSRSVPNLLEDNVEVLDSSGQRIDKKSSIFSHTSNRQKEAIERNLEQKVRNLIAPFYDLANVGISAVVVLEQTRISESVKGERLSDQHEQLIVRKVQTTDKTRKRPGSTIVDEEFATETFERQIEYGVGEIKRISLSVILPKHQSIELEPLNSLLSDSVGLDTGRGDNLTIIEVPVTKENKSPANLNTVGREVAHSPSDQSHVVIEGYDKQIIATILLFSMFFLGSLAFSLNKNKKNRLSKNEKEQIIKNIQVWANER